MRVEVRQPDGLPIPGLALGDCAELIDDRLARPVRLYFVLPDDGLYLWRFVG